MATGHIRKRIGKNGAVSYQLTAEGERDPITGKRDRRFKTVNGTKKQAEVALRKMITDLEEGNITTLSSMKLADWIDQWLDIYLPNIEETTRVGYQEKVDTYIKPKLGHIPLKALKADNVQLWVNELNQRGLAPKTIRNAYNNLNAALKKAVVLRMIPYNPCEAVVLPVLKKYHANVYTTADIKRALKEAEGTDMYLIVLLLVSVGLRRGELAALRWENVDFRKGTISICENRVHGKNEVVTKDPKSAAGKRTIAVGDEVMAALSKAKLDYFRDRTEVAGFKDLGYVVRKPDGTPYHPDSLTTKWRRFVKAKALPSARLHDMRHSNATALIEAGVSARVVQQRLGHSDVNITLNTYTHVTQRMDENAAETIDKLIFGKASNG